MAERKGGDTWNATPFLKILPAFAIGIWLADGLPVAHYVAPAILVGGVSCWLISELAPLTSAWRKCETASIWMLVIGCGLTLPMVQACLRNRPAPPTKDQQDIAWLLEVRTPPEPSRRGVSFLALCWNRTKQGEWRQRADCLIYLDTIPGHQPWHTGDLIAFKKSPEPMPGPRNPGGFDARAYYQRQGANLTVHLNKGDYHNAGHCSHHPLRDGIFTLQAAILQRIRNRIDHPDAIGLAEALLIGYRGDLGQSLQASYAEAGVIHIIAISGMHIGMLYALLSGVFGQLPFPQRRRWLLSIPSLTAIWCFCLLAGAGPSVVRSAAQFSLIGVGNHLTGRRGNNLNTLAASAFLLMAFRPDWIKDLGFQLSYAAVLGILLFHSTCNQWLPIQHPIGRYLRDGVSLTLSAQVLTTPILLYQFGRFPTWFLLTNLVAVPFSSCILMAVLLLCLITDWEPVCQWLGTATESGILFLNDYVHRTSLLPASQIEGVHLTMAEVIVCYLIITSARHWGSHAHPRSRGLLAISLAIFSLAHAFEWLQRSHQRKAVIWHLPGESLVLLVDGHTGYAYAKKSPHQTDQRMQKALQSATHHYHLQHIVMEADALPSTKVIAWRGYTIALLGRSAHTIALPGQADCVLLTDNALEGFRDGPPPITSQRWIADGSNSLWKIQQWQEASAGLPLPLHSTSRLGAFVHTLGDDGRITHANIAPPNLSAWKKKSNPP